MILYRLVIIVYNLQKSKIIINSHKINKCTSQMITIGQIYTLKSSLGGGEGQDLDVGSTFRIKFSICE